MARREKVIEVLDGDTFKTASRKNPVRLARVNAPEKDERGGGAATKALRDLILGEEVTIETVGRSYGRAVANVKLGRRSVNKAMKEKINN